MRPVSLSRSRMIDSAVTLLPQPDSPTSPTVSPSAMSKLTPLTARTSPSLVKNEVRRSLTRNSGAPFRLWPERSTTKASLPSMRSVVDECHAAVDDGHVDRNVLDPLRRDGERILRQHGEIGELARLDRAFDAFVEAIIGGVDGEHAQSLNRGDRLIGADCGAAPDLPRHRRAHVAQRIGRPVARPVGARRDRNAGFEQRL